ncbi:MAG: hypothetical protein KAV82_07330 [Phycisphaerae bacterium]|nr:hypothetical protein [Phycisphaerae bacterium]
MKNRLFTKIIRSAAVACFALGVCLVTTAGCQENKKACPQTCPQSSTCSKTCDKKCTKAPKTHKHPCAKHKDKKTAPPATQK